MLFLDNAAPDSCCAERPLHIPTYPHLVSTAAMVREKTWVQTHKPSDKPTNYNNAQRGLIIIIIHTVIGLTGSARMTTSTVALPGVSRLTRGVRMLPPASFTLLSMAGSCEN